MSNHQKWQKWRAPKCGGTSLGRSKELQFIHCTRPWSCSGVLSSISRELFKSYAFEIERPLVRNNSRAVAGHRSGVETVYSMKFWLCLQTRLKKPRRIDFAESSCLMCHIRPTLRLLSRRIVPCENTGSGFPRAHRSFRRREDQVRHRGTTVQGRAMGLT